MTDHGHTEILDGADGDPNAVLYSTLCRDRQSSGSHDICEEFVRLSKPALREGAKPIVYKCIPVDISKDVLTESLSERTQEMTKPYLHVEIEDILARLTTREISDLVNQRSRYRNRKGQVGTTTPSQINARVSKYPALFERDGGKVRLLRP